MTLRLEIPEAVDLYLRGLSLSAIAEKLEVSRTGVNNYLERRGVSKRSVSGGHDVPVELAKEMYEGGKTVYEIGKELGFSGGGIFRALQKLGIEFRPNNPRGRPWAIKKRGEQYPGTDGRWWVRGPYGRKKAKHRSVVVWEKTRGRKVPKGFHIHHRDEDIQNDDPSIFNLKKPGIILGTIT